MTYLKKAFLTSTLLLPSLLYAGNEYNATSFNLVGPDGRVTAQLTSSVEGTPAIFFYDENHTVRLNLGIYPGGAPGVILMDKDGNASAILRLDDDGKTPVLVFKEGGADKKIIGIGKYEDRKEEKKVETQAAVIQTEPIRTKAEQTREYEILGIAFGLGLIGAYAGGRFATRHHKPLEEALRQAQAELIEAKANAEKLSILEKGRASMQTTLVQAPEQIIEATTAKEVSEQAPQA